MSVARYFDPRLRERLIRGDYPEWLRRHSRKSYIVAAVISSPPWVDRKEMERMRLEARRLTESTGIKHVLDHIIPLTHPMVCGLSVPWNMQIITHAQNAAKSNKWAPDQLELPLVGARMRVFY